MLEKSIFFLIILLCLVFACLPAGMVLAADKIDINSATLSQLDELTGIGPKYAQAIIDGRPYASVDDLDRVKGIGSVTLQKIKDQGLACVNCSAVIPSLTGNPGSAESTLDSRLRGNDNSNVPVVYPGGVFINEILPNPAGADETEEWIELYNSNNFEVDLSGWQIKDVTGTPTTFTIDPSTSSGQAKISANGFLVFKRPETKIMLNNEQDGLSLLTPDKKVVDSVNFTSAPLGQSYNKTGSGWKWSTGLTLGSANIIATVVKATTASATKKASQTDLSKTENSVKNSLTEAGLADISQTTNPWFLFFSALAITIILASLTLFIKLKLQKNVRT